VSKILWLSDAGSHGGFATVTHQIGERLVRDYGHDIHVLAVNYKGDHWDTNLKLYVPTLEDPNDIMGMSRIVKLTAQIMPDAVVFVNDPKVVLNTLIGNPFDPEHVLWRGLQMSADGPVYKPPILAYLAIDGYNSPRLWDLLADRVTRIAMSHHGQLAMPEAPVVWHGVDTSVFYPRDKAEAKRALGYDPDRFLILRVDKNTWRKDYPASWKALRPVLRAHPEIDVHFHTRRSAADGYDLESVRFNDEDIRDRVNMTADLALTVGVEPEQLATLMSAADLFLTTSWGEGFGLTILEAMACGTPVIAQDCSAISEVVGDTGILIKPKDRMFVPMGQEQCVPDVERFSYWIEHMFNSHKQREALGRAAAERAKNYSWDVATAKFDTLIQDAVAAEQPVTVSA
jgi:glycosyltransferase involved in cell wall biosynthesis